MQHTFKNGDRMVKNKEWKEHLWCQFLAQLSIAEGEVLGSVWLCEALLNGGCGKQIRREKLVSVTSVFCVVLACAEGVKFFLSNLRPVLHGNPFGPVDLGYGRAAFLLQFLLLPSSRELEFLFKPPNLWGWPNFETCFGLKDGLDLILQVGSWYWHSLIYI